MTTPPSLTVYVLCFCVQSCDMVRGTVCCMVMMAASSMSLSSLLRIQTECHGRGIVICKFKDFEVVFEIYGVSENMPCG